MEEAHELPIELGIQEGVISHTLGETEDCVQIRRGLAPAGVLRAEGGDLVADNGMRVRDDVRIQLLAHGCQSGLENSAPFELMRCQAAGEL